MVAKHGRDVIRLWYILFCACNEILTTCTRLFFYFHQPILGCSKQETFKMVCIDCFYLDVVFSEIAFFCSPNPFFTCTCNVILLWVSLDLYYKAVNALWIYFLRLVYACATKVWQNTQNKICSNVMRYNRFVLSFICKTSVLNGTYRLVSNGVTELTRSWFLAKNYIHW